MKILFFVLKELFDLGHFSTSANVLILLTCANTSGYCQQIIHVSLPKDFDASRGVDISKKGNKGVTCKNVFATLLQNELNNDVERFSTHQSNLSCFHTT